MDRLSTNPVLPSILSYLPMKDLNNSNLVCKRFQETIERNRGIMAKKSIRMEIYNFKNAIYISEKMRSQMCTIPAWQTTIFENRIRVRENPKSRSGIANFIAKRRGANDAKCYETFENDEYWKSWKNFDFEIANNSEGIKEVVKVIKERFNPTELTLSGALSADQFGLIVPLLKNIRRDKLEIEHAYLNDAIVKVLKASVYSMIRVETREGDGSLLFQLNTPFSYIYARCQDFPITILESALKEWSEGKRDILRMSITCPNFILSTEKLRNLFNNLDQVTNTEFENQAGVKFGLKRASIYQNRKLYVSWSMFPSRLIISSRSNIKVSMY